MLHRTLAALLVLGDYNNLLFDIRVIGIDVWTAKGEKSVAAIVASYGPSLTKYYSETVHMDPSEFLLD